MSAHRRIASIIIGGALGNLVEWYNFLLYGFLATAMSRIFFPPAVNHLLSLMLVFLVFAIGFLARPLGSLLFGYIGDKYGRQKALVLTLVTMAIPTFTIAFLPTYDQLGVISPILLTLCRIIQGLSIGGEYTGSAIYIGEHAPPKWRGLWVSTIPATTALGILLGSVVALLVVKTISPAELLSWGWRVPFIVGGFFCLLGLWMRLRLPETPAFAKLRETRELESHSLRDLFRNPAIRTRIFMLILLASCYGVFYQILFIWMPTFLTSVKHIPYSEALTIDSLSMLLFFFCIPAAGFLSDRVGHKNLLCGATIALLIGTYPLFSLLAHGSIQEVKIAMASMTVLFSLYVAGVSISMVEMFPTAVRFTAMSLSYNIAFAAFGGTAPLVVTALLHWTNRQTIPAVYLTICASAALLAALSLMTKKDLTDDAPSLNEASA